MIGLCQDASIHFHPTTVHFYEMEALMKILVTKQVLPSDKPLAQIRTITDMAQYLLFPFMRMF